MKSSLVFECNNCHANRNAMLSLSARKFEYSCLRCEAQIETDRVGTLFSYCPACSTETKRCHLCGLLVAPNGAPVLAPNYAPKNFKEAYQWLKKARPGDLVLIVVKKYEFSGCTGFGYRPQPEDYVLKISFNLGVLSEHKPFVVFEGDDKKFSDSVGVSFRRNVSWWGYDFHLESISVKLHHFLFLDGRLGEPLYGGDPVWADLHKREEASGLKKPDYPLEIIIGQEAIETYCFERRHGYREFYLKALDLLKLKTTMQAKRDWVNERRKDVFLNLYALYKKGTNPRHEVFRSLLDEACRLEMDKVSAEEVVDDKPWSQVRIDVSKFINALKKSSQQ